MMRRTHPSGRNLDSDVWGGGCPEWSQRLLINLKNDKDF